MRPGRSARRAFTIARAPLSAYSFALTVPALLASTLLASEWAGVLNAQQPAVRPAGTSPAPQVREHPLRPAIRIAQASLDQLGEVRDYECVLTKRERINNQLNSQVMFMRVREKPFSIYCKFGEPYTGREVLYVDGQNNGMMLAHEGSGVRSLVGTVSLQVDGPEAKAENRHPLPQAGLRNMLALLVKQWEAESQYAETDVQYYPQAQLGEIECKVIEVSHPRPRRQFNYHITRLYLDAKTNLPVRVENYGWPQAENATPVLIEEYTYLQVRTNVGLTDQQFDRSCPEYKF